MLGTCSPGGSHGDLVVRRWSPRGAKVGDVLVHRRLFHEEIQASWRNPAGKSALTNALDVDFTLSAPSDGPGREHQTKCQTFTGPSGVKESGSGPGARPDCAQPPLGEVTMTPSGHFGKAPSEQGATGGWSGGGRDPSRREKGQRPPRSSFSRART